MKSEKELRPILIKGAPSITNGLGYFHRWCAEPWTWDTELGLTKTLALVELTDGSVKFIEPEYIKFTKPYKVK